MQNYPTDQSKTLLAALQEGTEETVLMRPSQIFEEVTGTAVKFDTTDGLRIEFDGGDIIHLGPSGNATELRCYTESATAERASFLNAAVFDIIRDLQQ